MEGPAVSFCPSNLTVPNKSHHPPLCHPERNRISYVTALPAATYAALRKESRMRSTEATVLTGNLGQPSDLLCAPAPAQRSPFRSVSSPANFFSPDPSWIEFFPSLRIYSS